MNWEDGLIKTGTIAATAGNVATNLTPNAGKKWKINYVSIHCTTSGDAANRYIKFEITNSGGTQLFNLTVGAVLVASKVGAFDIVPNTTKSPNVSIGDPAHDTNDWICVDNLIISGTDRLKISIQNGVAADSYSGYYQYIELPV